MSGPRVFGLPHLSEDAVAAFADGVLSAAAASRAQRHCAECAECADAVRGQREAAMMLRTAQAPALPSGLLDRLAGLPMSAPLPPPRGGLPTVLGADGKPVFVAHDVHKAAHAPGLPKPPEAPAQARHTHRRTALPVTVLASAAAVVAAGTFGGQVSTLAAANRQPVAGAAANAAGALTGGQTPAPRPVSPLAAAGSLVGAGSLLPASGPTARGGIDQPARAALTSGDQALSVTLAPLRQAQQPSTGAWAGSPWTARPADQASSGRSSAAGTPTRLAEEWNSSGFLATPAGAPIATP